MSTQTEAERLANALAHDYSTEDETAASNELRRLSAANAELLEALQQAGEFIDGIREDLHHERATDWYPEGANNAALSMSENMRLIGNRCADFDKAAAAIAKHQK